MVSKLQFFSIFSFIYLFLNPHESFHVEEEPIMLKHFKAWHIPPIQQPSIVMKMVDLGTQKKGIGR
jgi:hypothetical protein